MASPFGNRSDNSDTLIIHLDDGSGLPKPKRPKTLAACGLCRARKSKCDGTRPRCGACLKRKNCATACVYSEKKACLDLERNASEVSPGLDVSLTPSAPTDSTTGQYGRKSYSGTPFTPIDISSTKPDESPLEVQPAQGLHFAEDPSKENDAMGNIDNWGLRAGLYGASSSVTFMHSICNLVDNHKNPSHALPARPATPTLRRPLYRPRLLNSLPKSTEYLLPPRRTANRLLDIHWNYSHVIFPWIDRLRFTRWYESLWTGQEQNDLEIDEQAYHCMLNTIFAISYKLDSTVSSEEQESLSDSYFMKAQKLLSWNLLDISHIESLQALLLMAQYLQSTSMPRGWFECVGLAIHVARNMGFHIPGRVSSFQNEHECEMARRLWYGCILMDRTATVTLGRATRISEDEARQDPLPAAVDDEHLNVSGFEKGLQPPDRPSKLKCYVAYCELHLILGDMLSTIYAPRSPSGHPSIVVHIQNVSTTGKQIVDHLLRLEKALEAWRSGLPQYLRLEGQLLDRLEMAIFRRQAIGLYLRYLHVRTLLYRPFFSESSWRQSDSVNDGADKTTQLLVDVVPEQGLIACVTAAQQMLDVISDNLRPAGSLATLPPWWHVISYVYSSTTIVIAAHIFPAVLLHISIDKLTTSVEQGLCILQHFESDRTSARRCKIALEILYHKVLSPTNGRQTPTGTDMSVGRINNDTQSDMNIPALADHDLSCLDFFDVDEVFWLNSAPFDPGNHSWL